MPGQQASQSPAAARRRAIRGIARRLRLVLILLATITVLLLAFGRWRNELLSLFVAVTSGTPSETPGSTAYVSRYPTPQRTPTPAGPAGIPEGQGKRIGILAGHAGPEGDPGAVCADGLWEADINLAVAERVVSALRAKGYQVDLLDEYDQRLTGYLADAMVSIHTDSCDAGAASGFKVARVANSAIPEVEDRLVECLYQEYAYATGLPRHDSSITLDMHGYHAFNTIAAATPGAIIELGFMAADRGILEHEPDRLAEGIVNGLSCFLAR